jgi:hypothetical protein
MPLIGAGVAPAPSDQTPKNCSLEVFVIEMR